jgi:hypothetical protein
MNLMKMFGTGYCAILEMEHSEKLDYIEMPPVNLIQTPGADQEYSETPKMHVAMPEMNTAMPEMNAEAPGMNSDKPEMNFEMPETSNFGPHWMECFEILHWIAIPLVNLTEMAVREYSGMPVLEMKELDSGMWSAEMTESRLQNWTEIHEIHKIHQTETARFRMSRMMNLALSAIERLKNQRRDCTLLSELKNLKNFATL